VETCLICQILMILSARILPRSDWNMNLRFKRKLSHKWQGRRIPSTLLKKFLDQTCPCQRRRRRFTPRSTSSLINHFTIKPSSLLTLLREVTTRLWTNSHPTRRILLSSLNARSQLKVQRRDLISSPHITLNRHQWFPLLQTIET
jgi:hypothetical protein